MNDTFLKSRKDILSEALFLLTAFIASFLFSQLRITHCERFASPEMFQEMASGIGHKPWQYRILIPEIASFLNHVKLPARDSLYGWAKILEMVFMVLAVVAFRRYLYLLLKNKEVSTILSFSLFLILPFHIFFPRPYYANYWFDTPALFFFTLGLVLLYEKRMVPYYILFVIATLNRETTCFLTLVFLVTSLGHEKLVKIIGHCAAQFVIWMTIKTVLAKIYINNPGADGFEWYDGSGLTHYADNLLFFSNPKNYPALFSFMGFIWIPILFYYKRITDEFVQRSLWVCVPYFAGMFLVANIYELRIYTELAPLFLSAFFLILIDLIKSGSTSVESAEIKSI